MNLKSTLFFVALFAMPLTSQAIVGGPFDGNDYSQSFDSSGVYQTAMRFKNGSGFSQFNNATDLVSQSTTGTTRGSYLNRSVVYVNGIVYIGTATGIVDHEAKLVMGYSNGSTPQTDATYTNTLVTSDFAGSQSGGTANTMFTAKIICTAPELRYSGTGEITVLSTVATDVASLIQDQINGGGGALATILTITDPNAGPNETVEQIIEFNRALLKAQIDAVNALRAFSTRISSSDNGFSQKMTVFGGRKFFIGRN